MKAAVVIEKGQAPQFLDFPEPVAGEGEVIARMAAAGLHPIVKSLASGQHYSSGETKLPAVPGLDGVGTLPDGRTVYCVGARSPFGTMAERTAVSPKTCIALPEGLDPLQAAAIANPGMSAWLSLTLRGALAPGETALILGATGVAGQLAVQSARYLGAKKVIAAGRNLDALKSLPVDATISLSEPEESIGEAFAAQLADGGVDLVVDYLWGRPTELFLAALAKTFRRETTHRTRLVEVGATAGPNITLPAAVLRSVDLTLLGGGFGSVPLDKILGAIPTLFSLARDGHLRVAVEPVPLAQVETAWNAVEKGKRIVFTI